MTEIKTRSYTLRTDQGTWLGQIVITSDGMFSGVTDYGNFSYAWRSFGDDFRQFLLSLNSDYFGTKIYTGLSYFVYGKKYEKECQRFARHILPALQVAIQNEINNKIDF